MEHRRTIRQQRFVPHLRNSSPFTCHVSRVAKEINLQKRRIYLYGVSGKICAVSRLTAPVSSYKRAVFARVSHVVHRQTYGFMAKTVNRWTIFWTIRLSTVLC